MSMWKEQQQRNRKLGTFFCCCCCCLRWQKRGMYPNNLVFLIMPLCVCVCLGVRHILHSNLDWQIKWIKMRRRKKVYKKIKFANKRKKKNLICLLSLRVCKSIFFRMGSSFNWLVWLMLTNVFWLYLHRHSYDPRKIKKNCLFYLISFSIGFCMVKHPHTQSLTHMKLYLLCKEGTHIYCISIWFFVKSGQKK